jgi:katanin p80 WD40 repeat-containing subunit B1
LNVNCAKFGRRASRRLITGGEDLKVNLWAIGKPGALLVISYPDGLCVISICHSCSFLATSTSGFTSPVESVSFDSSEVTIGAGAASGTIKIWNIEEAKGINQSWYSTVSALKT